MEVQSYKCDCCGKIESNAAYNEPTGWINVTLNTENEKNYFYRRRDICGLCAEEVGLLHAMDKIRTKMA